MSENAPATTSLYINDSAFDQIYPEKIQQLSRLHWTPIDIAKKSAKFLAAESGTKILDIGSGVGKFCLIGAHYFPFASFYGVEQREELHYIAVSAQKTISADNVNFICDNFTQMDLTNYDHFYFYNSFFENIASNGHIDQDIDYSTRLYRFYSYQLLKALDKKPCGTRLVTFHSLGDEVPPSYQMVDATVDLCLKMWIRR